MKANYTIDPIMYDLFRSEAETHTAILRKLGEGDTKVLTDDELLDKALKSVRSLKGAAKLANLAEIALLTNAFENYLNHLVIAHEPISAELAAPAIETAGILRSLHDIDSQDILNWLEDKQVNLQEISTRLEDAIKARQKPEPDEKKSVTDAVSSQNEEQLPSIDPGFASDASMLELFKLEVESHYKTISEALLALEQNPREPKTLESLMRASHSIKGAARMVGVLSAVNLAHTMEDCFVAAQKGQVAIDPSVVDVFLKSADYLVDISLQNSDSYPAWLDENMQSLREIRRDLQSIANNIMPAKRNKEDHANKVPIADAPPESPGPITHVPGSEPEKAAETANSKLSKSGDVMVRIHADRLNRLLGLSSELMVSEKWIGTHIDALQNLKRKQSEVISTIENLKHELDELEIEDRVYDLVVNALTRADSCRNLISEQLSSVDEFDRKTHNLSTRLNYEVISSRMRPFRDGVHAFQRMVRDISRSLGKKVTLEIKGLDTQVDSDILDRIEAPLNHLLRNAVDHGIETQEERAQTRKNPAGKIVLEAYHNAGMLIIAIVDDGRGIDLEKLKRKIIDRRMVSEAMAEDLSESELLDFLFLPGFSTREEVTEYSGRGVGLDVVHSVIQEMRGQIRCHSTLGQGMHIQLQLPLTLSVMRTLVVEISSELYAFPLARMHKVLQIYEQDIFSLEHKQFIKYNNVNIGLVEGRQILEKDLQHEAHADHINVIIINDRGNYYGIVVDKVIGEYELALHMLDSRLGKIRDINCAAIMDDGVAVLVIDVDDMIVSLQDLINGNNIRRLNSQFAAEQESRQKRVLVVDDSLTVREVERKLLESKGYYVDVAVDGMDGWNTVRNNPYDLVISDIDMPRMNGIEFVGMIKGDSRLKSIPVMIVSYKDNPEDKRRGLNAGADYYLAKGSFHDESMIEAVIDLIGEPNK